MLRTSLRWMRIAAVLCVVSVVQARPSVAAPVGLAFTFESNAGYIEWGDAGFTALAGTGAGFGGGFTAADWFEHCACDQSLFTAGTAVITTGPLLSATVLSPLPGEVTRYDFGPGEIRIAMEWLEGGIPQTGGFVAPIPSLRFDLLVFGDDVLGWVSDTYVPIGGRGLPIGPGLFDASLAGFLGVAPQTIGGWLNLQADTEDPDYPDLRIGHPRYLFYNETTMTIVAVPEPASLTLLLVGTIGLSHRLRSRHP